MIRQAFLFFCSAGLALVFFFQNCSRVPLETALPGVTIFSVEGAIDICLEKVLENYTLDNLVITNLNLTSSRGRLLVDSDSDGIADVDEVGLGFDPLKRRSNGQVLDSICLNVSGSSNCLEQVSTCSSSINLLGLNDCDLKIMRLDTLDGHPTQGLDSDKDGLIDILEVLSGTLANKGDRNDDPDHDGVMNWVEIQQGTSPVFANTNVDQSRLIEYSTTQAARGSSCAGELWKVKVKRLPLIEAKAYEDPSDSVSPLSPTLSHDENENVITVFLKLKTRTGSGGNSRVYFKDFKLNRLFQGFGFSIEDFKFAGEVLP
jgi:hypothetical protein